MLSTEILFNYRQISQQLLTVVDVETTGYKPAVSRVIEVSVLQATLADGIVQQQTHLLNPQVSIPAQISRFTGISQAMVDRAADSAEVWPQCWSWLNCGIFTAHNLEFDYGFVQAEYARLGCSFQRPSEQQLCTVLLSRLMLPDLPSRSLPNLVQHFGFAVGRSHRAEADTIACWLLAQRLLTEILNEADEVLLARFGCQWLPIKWAAEVLGCAPKQVRSRLSKAGIEPQLRGQYKMPMYQRSDVERVYWAQDEPEQGRLDFG